MAIFCNFFSLCINKLRKICKKSCSKLLTIFENVVSLQRVKHLTETNQITLTTKNKKKMTTTNTIKGIEVIAYKGMNSDMTCRGFQYELGKSYKTDKAELCECGFHACLNPINVLEYYSKRNNSRYFKVKLSGEITKCDDFDTKVAATEITILEEISIDELNNITEWWKNDNVLDLLYFSDGLASIERGDTLYNFIDKEGKLLLKEWFEWLDNFFEGFAIVQREDKLYNLITKEGKIISNEWFEFVHCFEYGFAVVERTNGEQAKIDKNGKIVSIIK